MITVEIMRLRTKVYLSINSYTTFVHLGPYMLLCACVCNTLTHNMSLFLWRQLENYLDIWLISLLVMAWVSLMLKLSSKWGMSQICWTFTYLLPSLLYHYFLLLVERSSLEINAKGGEILGDSVREERLICVFKGVKGRHIRIFIFNYVVYARIV